MTIGRKLEDPITRIKRQSRMSNLGADMSIKLDIRPSPAAWYLWWISPYSMPLFHNHSTPDLFRISIHTFLFSLEIYNPRFWSWREHPALKYNE